MGRSVVLNVRMDHQLKHEATKVLDSIGLSASDAVRILFTRIVRQRAFPVELRVPTAQSEAAIRVGDEETRTEVAPDQGAQALLAHLADLVKKSDEARAAALRPPASSP